MKNRFDAHWSYCGQEKKYTLKVCPGSYAISDGEDKLRKTLGGRLAGKQIEDTFPLNIMSRYEIAPLTSISGGYPQWPLYRS